MNRNRRTLNRKPSPAPVAVQVEDPPPVEREVLSLDEINAIRKIRRFRRRRAKRKEQESLEAAAGLFPDKLIISHPGSGLTWMRNMIWEYRKIEHSSTIGGDDWTEWGHRTLAFYHDLTGEDQPHRRDRIMEMMFDPRMWSGHYERYAELERIILLIRNPVDAVISSYHRRGLAKFWLDRGKGIYGLLKDREVGLVTTMDWLNLWLDQASREPEKFIVIRYEDTVANPVRSLRAVVAGSFGDPKEESIELAVERSGFDTMKENEELRVRRGPRGGWRDEVIEKFHPWILETCSPVAYMWGDLQEERKHV